jgi:hypothetical protein
MQGREIDTKSGLRVDAAEKQILIHKGLGPRPRGDIRFGKTKIHHTRRHQRAVISSPTHFFLSCSRRFRSSVQFNTTTIFVEPLSWSLSLTIRKRWPSAVTS